MSLDQRKRVSAEIAKEYRKWRQEKGEPSEAQRKQIVAIGMSKARKNPLDIGMALVGGMAAGATGALVRHAMENPGWGEWFVGVTEQGEVEIKKTTAPLHEKWVRAYGPMSLTAAKKQAASVRDWFRKGSPVQGNGEMVDGLHIEYSNVNRAWFLMWNDQVLRFLGTKQEAQREMEDLLRKNNPRSGGNEASYRRMVQLLRAEKAKRAKLIKYGLPTQAVDQGIKMFEAEMKRYSGKFGSNPLLQTIMGANPPSGPMDETASRELELFITSDADLYRQQYTPIIQNLMRKRAKGVFDPAKAVTLFMYLVDAGARKYTDQFGTRGDRIDVIFNKNTRLDVAKTLTESFIAEADLGNYDRMVGGNPLTQLESARGLRRARGVMAGAEQYGRIGLRSSAGFEAGRAVGMTDLIHQFGTRRAAKTASKLSPRAARMGFALNPKYKPNGFVYIDSSNDAILGFWKGSMTDKKAFTSAENLAKKLGRNVHIVASPGFPSWMKQPGAQVSKIFYHMGPYQTITPSGEYISGGRDNPGLPCPPYCPNPGRGHRPVGRFAGENPPRFSVLIKCLQKSRITSSVADSITSYMGNGLGLESAFYSVFGRGFEKKLASFRAECPQARFWDNPNGHRLTGRSAGKNPLTRRETRRVMSGAEQTLLRSELERRPVRKAFGAGWAGGASSVVASYGDRQSRDRARMIGGESWSAAGNNPGKKKVTMSVAKFAAMLQKKGDPKMIAAFQKKIQGYKKWTHGTIPKTVTLEQRDIPGVSGLWITYAGGKEPESTYIMPGNSKRKGAWKHKWDTMPGIQHDPEAGIILKNLRGQSKITDFYHK